jgi:AcrR family transcriptional regulator
MAKTETARRSIGATRNPDSERAILDAARELLAEKGLSGFSIEAVARRARAGKPTIYRWWPDKTQLLLAVYAGIKRDVVDPDTGSLEGDIAGFLRSVIGFWRDTEAGRIFRSVLAESQNDAGANAALVSYHLERRRQTARMFARPYPGAIPLTAEVAEDLAEMVVAFALAQLILGSLDVEDAEIDRVAAQFARGAGG